MVSALFFSALLATSTLAAPPPPPAAPSVKLPITPQCGVISAAAPKIGSANLNLSPLTSYETFVSFGDGFVTLSKSAPALPQPGLDPAATSTAGRMSNGPVWSENFAGSCKTSLKSFVSNGTTAQEFLIPGHQDVRSQANDYTNTRAFTPANTTLHIMTAGNVDLLYTTDLNTISNAAGCIAYDAMQLSSYPAYGTDFLVVDNSALRNATTPQAIMYRTTLLQGLSYAAQAYNLKVGYVDLAPLYTAVEADPKSFGLDSAEACLTTDSTGAVVKQCTDPAKYLEWLPGYPSAAGHQLINSYVLLALETC